jgi:TonB family protein
MTTASLRLDLDQFRSRTRSSVTVSFIAHALLMAWIVLHHGAVPVAVPLTEITFLEPGDPAASAAPAPSPAGRETVRGLSARADVDAHFQRQMTRSEVAPDPQRSWVFEDRLDARLAAMQQSATQVTPGIAVSSAPTAVFGSGVSPAAVGTGGIGTPIALSRGGGGGSAPLPLTHGSGHGGIPALATVGGSGPATDPAPARGGDASARRTIAGASLTGPIADRPVLSYSVPLYPEWAKREAVEGAVTLYFVVRPDGGVKENVLVQKTAGFEDFDDSARAAIRAWRFKPLASGQAGEQWGVITFNFRLRDAG